MRECKHVLPVLRLPVRRRRLGRAILREDRSLSLPTKHAGPDVHPVRSRHSGGAASMGGTWPGVFTCALRLPPMPAPWCCPLLVGSGEDHTSSMGLTKESAPHFSLPSTNCCEEVNGKVPPYGAR